MNRLILFLLGLKGYEVLRATVATNSIHQVHCVVFGTDSAIEDDYSLKIRELCMKSNITCVSRNDYIRSNNQDKDLVALAAGWRWLIRNKFRYLVVIHDSLLPKYRGFSPLISALLARDRIIGVTAFIADNSFDRGDIVLQMEIEISYPMKIYDAIVAISGLYYSITLKLISLLLTKSSIVALPQNENDASYSVWRDNEDYRIAWNNSAEEILHFINCVGYPFKGALSFYNNEIIRILDAEVVPDLSIVNRTPGKVLFYIEHSPVVICGKGLLKLISVKTDDGIDLLPFKKYRVRLD